jgi:hypothetical protein
LEFYYIIANLNKNHWVLYVADLKGKTIKRYDSLTMGAKQDDLRSPADKVCRSLTRSDKANLKVNLQLQAVISILKQLYVGNPVADTIDGWFRSVEVRTLQNSIQSNS